ncbi:Gfo/Idh/MocA family protein [Virgibacillus soli]|uniref:Gfo/Idh/MocA family oxidoreductase n=1 Tax=Paracerasibacillus soli TaxID=480284 RepID=A0ABU5CR41_9BACI|nr:Gfo/Idh/MocA family oxidoreductase [Virgibacillus soli]MDY0407935.1 Gfo/Idh/MocA family oxidoreductase [Virgibacillus soli]
MKIGMIGIGDIAKKAYLPVLTQLSGIELHICTRNKATLQEVTEKYRLQHSYDDMEQWLASGIKAAFVHSSTESHEQIIDTLLDHDIHVYVDKPITYDGESSKRLIEKAQQKGLLLMVGFNRRYAPPYEKLADLPNPNMVIVQKNRAHHVNDIRTFIFDDFIHVIDTLLYLFPYSIEQMHVRGKQDEQGLHHVVLQLEANEGTGIGIMNRDSGTTEEHVKVFSSNETRTVQNVNEVSSHQNKDVVQLGSNDWEPTLHKRGFHAIIARFLEKVKSNTMNVTDYEQDLRRHLLAEEVVQALIDK